ncbi:MAG TPA: CHASE3 domain-containing protein [Geobacteraceae bacterium]
MMSLNKDSVITVGFGVALVIMAAIGYLYHRNVTAMTDFDRMVERSYAVVTELDGLLADVNEVDSGEHVFIVTGEDDFLAPYRASLSQIDRRLARLKELTRNHPSQEIRVRRIEKLVRGKTAEAAQTIKIRTRGGFLAAVRREKANEHKPLMDEIHGELNDAREAVMAHLGRRQAAKEESTRNTIRVFYAGNALGLALILTTFLLLRRDITERKRAEEEIERLNTDLAARAAQLEEANRELEAFNYSVAHDLRKPLTVINGYCQAIRELCGGGLSAECSGYLKEAYDGTLRMDGLIDALLNFSRMARIEPQRETVDLSRMAQEALAQLRLAEPQRRVTLRIAEGVMGDGDEGLLRVVLDNLLGNAWKFTCMRDEGIIEFGAEKRDGQLVFFVRDNGAGFAMADAEKLFAPFQRLPGAEVCKGFGIGLATVRRIIQRHGGRVWAEGAPDVGATFYFALSDVKRIT